MPSINDCPSCDRPMSLCKCGGPSGGSGEEREPENVNNATQLSSPGDIHIFSDSTDKVVIKCSDAKTYNQLVSHLLDLDLLLGDNPNSVSTAIQKTPRVNQNVSEPPTSVNEPQTADQDVVTTFHPVSTPE